MRRTSSIPYNNSIGQHNGMPSAINCDSSSIRLIKCRWPLKSKLIIRNNRRKLLRIIRTPIRINDFINNDKSHT